MNKLSTTDVTNILAEVPVVLRALNEKCASLQEKVAYYEKKERVEKIAQQMQEKNLRSDLNYQEKVDNLMSLPEYKLNATEEAVGMQPTQIGFGELDRKTGNTVDPLAAFYEGLSD